jgi:enoyl-CoA hydratase
LLYPADRAVSLGIVNYVVEDGDETNQTLSIDRAISRAQPSAARLTKLAINRSFDAMGLRNSLASAL